MRSITAILRGRRPTGLDPIATLFAETDDPEVREDAAYFVAFAAAIPLRRNPFDRIRARAVAAKLRRAIAAGVDPADVLRPATLKLRRLVYPRLPAKA